MRMLLALLLATPFACADEKPWKGEQIYSKQRKKETTFGDRIDDKDVAYEFSGSYPLKVLDETSDKLRVNDGKHEGWVLKSQFVRSAEAPGYYADRVKAKPDDAFAIFMLGALARVKGDHDASIKHFTECIRLEPGETAHYYARGGSWILKDDKPKAIKDYDEVIRLDPQNVRAFVSRGNARSNGDEHDKAMKDYDEAIRLDPQHVPAYLHRGDLRTNLRSYDVAIKDYDEAIRLDPKRAGAFNSRAIAWLHKNEFDKGMKDCDEAIRLDPKFIAPYCNHANLRLLKNDHAGAVKDCEEILRLDSKCCEGYLYRAMARHNLKDYATAVPDYEKAMEFDASLASQLNFAQFLSRCPDAKFRDGAKAVRLVEDAIKKAGKEAGAWMRSDLAAALAETGDFDGAVREQRVALADPTLTKEQRGQQEKWLKLYVEKKPLRDE